MAKQTIQPRGKWVLVLPLIENNRETEQGLILPHSEEKDQKAQGTIVSVGDEVKGLKKGDVVIYGTYAGEIIKTSEDGKEVEYKLLYDDDVIAFVN